MKGLLIKDFRLMINQKKIFLMIFIIAVMLLFTNQGILFVVSYVTFISSFFVINTISYDEFDNGYLFLFTLPISRRDYITEKYCFGFFNSLILWGIVSLIATVYLFVQGELYETWGLECYSILISCLTMIGIFLPFLLKFGSEKGRIVLFGMIGVVCVIRYVLNHWGAAYFNSVSTVTQWIASLGPFELLGGISLIVAILLGISYGVSVHILNRKQF